MLPAIRTTPLEPIRLHPHVSTDLRPIARLAAVAIALVLILGASSVFGT